jgi:hypothetical protein
MSASDKDSIRGRYSLAPPTPLGLVNHSVRSGCPGRDSRRLRREPLNLSSLQRVDHEVRHQEDHDVADQGQLPLDFESAAR